ncbi:MAG: DNA gyrase subunit A [Clostridiales bacterium]|jgi:DNA gyrase subunit A|nr:DNA gyrase subunit A [Clostridiales bacterium]
MPNQKIIPVELAREMKKSYIDYAMSVIVGRALPDVRDGLKPVHRRILYTMQEAGFTPDKPHRKCATTVGDVLGKYHPHGDMSVYDALVRMAQNFSLRYPLIDGHGNFGSVDGDPPAAYRYTESRMSKIAAHMLADIDKETVDFMPNYDDRLQEPTVLPARFPNLLVNGSAGIAVGMATNIPPHNLGEVVSGIIALIDDPEITIDTLITHIKGPDFPTYGQIIGKAGIRSAYHTGRGKVTMRSRAEIETDEKGKSRIIVTELPYQVNKARLQEKIAELVKDKRIEGISDLRDESDRDGMRVVIEIKRDANANIVLNQLYKFTQMQETFSIINLALHEGQPKVMNLKEMLTAYVEFQKQVIVRRTMFDKKKAEARVHILEGYRIALDNIDEIIRIIRTSYDSAKKDLMSAFNFSEVQADAILAMQLRRLQGLEREKIDEEFNRLTELIAHLAAILADEHMVTDIIKQELTTLNDKFADPRRTEILQVQDEIDDEDLIPEEDCVLTLTHFGYIKRTAVDEYKAQRRGGRGVAGLQTREEDFAESLFIGSSHSVVMFFSDKGRMYKLKAYEIAESGRNARGTAIVNLLPLGNDEKITAMVPVPRDLDAAKHYLLMTTRRGIVKRTALNKYLASRRSGGVVGILLDEGDVLIQAQLTDGVQDVIIVTSIGMGIRFSETEVRVAGRVSRGSRGVRLRAGDHVIGATISNANAIAAENGTIAQDVGDDADAEEIIGNPPEIENGGDEAVETSRESEKSPETGNTYLLAVTEKGYGKRTPLGAYRRQSRGGMGSRTYKITAETGNIATAKAVTDNDDVLIITNEGVIIRMGADGIRNVGRVSKGVRLMRLAGDARVVGIGIAKRDES